MMRGQRARRGHGGRCVLGFGGHLGDGPLEPVGQEDRIVAESPAAARHPGQAALDPPGHHPFADAGRVPGPPEGGVPGPKTKPE
jgi:hypothetical protein